jgi:hypothetical protein
MFSTKANSTDCVGLVWFLQINKDPKTQALSAKLFERLQKNIFDTFNEQLSGNGTRKYIVSINNNICINICKTISALNNAKLNESKK